MADTPITSPTLALVAATQTSLTCEIRNDTCFRSEAAHRVRVNGADVLTTERNVFTVRDLKSDSEHVIEILTGGKNLKLTARTKALSAVLNPKDFGARGDGLTDDTRSLQAAISACPPHGWVRLPEGAFLSGPLFLKSHMTLEILGGARLLGLRDISQWPILPGTLHDETGKETGWLGSWEGEPQGCHAALINILSAEDVTVCGEGLIDGQAGFDTWWAHPKSPYASWRPRLIYAVDSRDLVFEGLTLAGSPSWNLHPLHCENVTAACLNISAPANSPNTDGLDPESCTHVVIAGIHFTVGDDCIAIKSGKLSMARKAVRPTRGVRISNCFMENGHGAVVIGSEMSSGVYDVQVRDCLFTGTDRGLRIKTRRGRGKTAIVRDIHFDNIRMEGVGTPFVINSFYWADPDGKTAFIASREAQPVDDGTPSLGGFHLSRITCTGVKLAAAYLLGLPEMPIDGIDINHFSVRYDPTAKPDRPDMAAGIEPVARMGLYISDARRIRLKNIDIEGQDGDRVRLEHVS